MKNHISIDTLPIANFQECLKSNLQYLYICDFFETPETYPPEFLEVFNSLIYQFDYLDNSLPQLRFKIEYFESKFLVTGNRKFINKKNDYLFNLKKIVEKKTGESNFVKQIGALERWLKYHIDIYKTSTRLFYEHLNSFSEYCTANE